MMTKNFLLCAGAAVLVLGCSTPPSPTDLDKITQATLQSSFRSQGDVKLDRLAVDESNRECDDALVKGAPLAPERVKAIEAANMKTLKWPADGKFLGDWREGEKIAQNGRGLTWTDNAKTANGGNCYNCHQITKEEISFGTIGPSLYNYAKTHGVIDPSKPESKAMVEYTWAKIWNARAYNACSNMPRFGHSAIIGEQQIKHVMALLLDPQSPVNK